MPRQAQYLALWLGRANSWREATARGPGRRKSYLVHVVCLPLSPDVDESRAVLLGSRTAIDRQSSWTATEPR